MTEKVRKLIFELFSEKSRPADSMTPQVSAYRIFYEGPHEHSLSAPLPPELVTAKLKTVKQIIDLWIYTHGVHTGKTQKFHEFELKDFDDVVTAAGRARFEDAFRNSLRLVGQNSYLSFHRVLVRPIFNRLLALGHVPNFETHAALKFGPYPQQADRILLDDPFWHLDKESEEETFDRLLNRWRFHDFGPFFNGYFRARRPALEALKTHATLDDLLKATGATILDTPSTTHSLGSQFHAKGDMNQNGGKVQVYDGKVVHFADRSRLFLSHHYRLLREAFFSHRNSIPQRSNQRDGNWYGN